jgi:uncharacterized protein YabN with tetrapyrrole methylase and pyrophosphatase domain
MAKSTGERFERAVSIMARLRALGGCPWDREQTFDSIKPYTLEETYEVLEAIDNRDWDELKGELGDLLLQVLFYSEMAQEQGSFSIDDVLDRLSNKLVDRHPHVFGDLKVKDVNQVWANWEKIKRAEKHGTRHARASALDGIPKHLPGLLRAEKLAKKAKRAELPGAAIPTLRLTRSQAGRRLLDLALYAQSKGWSAEDLLRRETQRLENRLRKIERSMAQQT